MRMKTILAVFTAVVLSGCLVSETPLFPENDAAKSVLTKNYVVTDAKSPIGQLTLTENDGEYTVTAASDKSATAELKVGRTFRLFPAKIVNHQIEQNFGPLRYYWVQGKKMSEPGFDYELLGITTRTNIAGVVFRWGLWTFNENEAFTNKLEELAASSNGQMTCTYEKQNSCHLKSTAILQRLSELIVETRYMPFRAYVPR